MEQEKENAKQWFQQLVIPDKKYQKIQGKTDLFHNYFSAFRKKQDALFTCYSDNDITITWESFK